MDDDDIEERKRIVRNAEELVKEAEPDSIAAVAIVMFYKAIAKAVSRGELPDYFLTKEGLSVAFTHTLFGSESRIGAAEYFDLPIMDIGSTSTPPKKGEMN
jgi:hypothetical protein